MKEDAGFTVVELLVVIGIVAVLAAVTIPGFLAFIPNYRLTGAAQELHGDIQMAKLRAIKNGVVVSISINTATDSYRMFYDDGAGANFGNGTWEQAEEESIKTAAMPTGVDIVGTTFTNDAILFNSRGLPHNMAAISQVNLRNSRGRTTSIVVDMAGSTSIQ